MADANTSELKAAVNTVLVADATLIALVPALRLFIEKYPPRNMDMPLVTYLTLSEVGANDANAGPQRDIEWTFQMDVVDDETATLDTISARIDDLLMDRPQRYGSWTTTNWRIDTCRRSEWRELTDEEAGARMKTADWTVDAKFTG